jgi:hypothetical protein
MSALAYSLQLSLQAHLASIWTGELYASDGTQSRAAVCPESLQALFTYTDRDGVDRVLGPSVVSIGRVQEDIIDRSGHLAVPSFVLEIYHHDPEEIEDWRDSIYQRMDDAQELDRYVGMEIGYRQRYHRRYVLKGSIYAMDADLDDAEIARLGANCESFLLTILNSAQTWRWQLPAAADEFGEAAWRCIPVISHNRRRGGPPDDYIWDIKIYFEVATWL